jgi:E3 ubiquitin-protein ligase synoviolin
MSGLFISLWIVDCLVFLFAAGHTLTNGVGGMVLFASEVGLMDFFANRTKLIFLRRHQPLSMQF